ncbi:MAG: GNAT family N-acetyltransferase [Planctomycetales bacterium]|nr:GNAT family N-acetyltransferase [Planctomycetales bacterium]
MAELPAGIARRIEEAGARHFRRRIECSRARPGNPAGVEIREFPGALAFVALARRHVDWKNGACFVSRPAEEVLDSILAFFRERGIGPRIEAPPGAVDEAVSRRLGAEGLVPGRGIAVLWGVPEVRPEPPGPIRVRRVGPEEVSRFAELYAGGFEMPAGDAEDGTADIARWPSVPGWTLHLAEVDGTPAGAALLSVDGGVAYLGSSATLPRWRRRGAHGALLRCRISDAARAGCEVVFARAEPGSASFRNMERAGLRLAYVKSVWVPPPG